jgi:hypothetical protein
MLRPRTTLQKRFVEDIFVETKFPFFLPNFFFDFDGSFVDLKSRAVDQKISKMHFTKFGKKRLKTLQ